ncbi:MAG: hypothetical protein ACTSVZ_06135 [Promethearchaeota archaeon]
MNVILIASIEIFIAVGIIGFWVYFFLVENHNPENTPIYLAFERSFPLPDLGFLTPALIIGAVGLLTEKPIGIVFTIAAGGALIFLILLDISFNAKNGGYTTKPMDTVINLVINGVSLVMGSFLILFGAQLI